MQNRIYAPIIERFEERLVPALTGNVRSIAAAVIRTPGIVRQADFSAVPLDEMTGTYKGKSGGLYGDGRNEVPAALAAAAEEAARSIRPLDARGNPANDGKIGMLAIGQSTTRMVFSAFRSAVRNMKASNVVLINGALDGNDSEDWAKRNGPWNQAIKQIGLAGANARQIQVLWVESALMFPARYGDFPAHNQVYANDLNRIVNQAKLRFPNLKLIFLSSRYYGGWTKKPTSPEPFAYESAFGVRDFLLSKIPQTTGSGSGNPFEPVVMWGPYFWNSGTTPSRVDGLVLNRADLVADGVHPTAAGAAKFADQLIRFFTQDRFARPWFTGVSA